MILERDQRKKVINELVDAIKDTKQRTEEGTTYSAELLGFCNVTIHYTKKKPKTPNVKIRSYFLDSASLPPYEKINNMQGVQLEYKGTHQGLDKVCASAYEFDRNNGLIFHEQLLRSNKNRSYRHLRQRDMNIYDALLVHIKNQVKK